MIGLVGGMSWYSTLEYYRVINTVVQERLGGHASAPLVLRSLDFAEVRRHQLADDWAAAAALLADAARGCRLAGAETVLVCTNLMHKVFDEVQARAEVPMLHIADAVAARAHRHGWGTVGLVGTRWVMEEDFYVERLRSHGLRVLVPASDDRLEIDRVVFEELTRGVVLDRSRDRYRRVLDALAAEGAQAVVLGCTEIELLVEDADAPVPLLDSMRVHAEAAAELVLADETAVTPPAPPPAAPAP